MRRFCDSSATVFSRRTLELFIELELVSVVSSVNSYLKAAVTAGSIRIRTQYKVRSKTDR